MKNVSLVSAAIAAALCLSAASPVAAQGSFKIGIIDMKRVFSEYYKTKDAEKSVNDGKEAAKKQLDERNAKYRDLIGKWQESQKLINDPAISEELRAQKKKEAEELSSEAKSLEREMAEFRQRRELLLLTQNERRAPLLSSTHGLFYLVEAKV
jgi:outer membrane protein